VEDPRIFLVLFRGYFKDNTNVIMNLILYRERGTGMMRAGGFYNESIDSAMGRIQVAWTFHVLTLTFKRFNIKQKLMFTTQRYTPTYFFGTGAPTV
jgi:predicted GNAT superfamily acetyltransferase